ncbi:hypothetical protein [Methanoregula sp.]|uniref:hypothetical protein n=1 Tax=Methanoregula sp. TaxID=2052170 RepID=UPI003562EC76
MTLFRVKPGTKSTVIRLKDPVSDIKTFEGVIRSLVLTNALECTSYRSVARHYPPVDVVREMYTAKFAYMDAKGKRIGSGSEVYNSIEGYECGIAAVISNMANIAAHCGKVKHLPGADLYSVTLKCHDPGDELFFLSIARNRVTLSSYNDDRIRLRVRTWVDGLPARAT